MFDSAGSPLDSYSNGGPWQVPLKHGQAQNKNETGVSSAVNGRLTNSAIIPICWGLRSMAVMIQLGSGTMLTGYMVKNLFNQRKSSVTLVLIELPI